MKKNIDISLAYMDDKVQWYMPLSVHEGSTLREVLLTSGWLERSELAWFVAWLDQTDATATPNHKAWFVGIYAQKKSLNYILQEGDRIEIYRPLIIDPMSKRKAKSPRVYRKR